MILTLCTSKRCSKKKTPYLNKTFDNRNNLSADWYTVADLPPSEGESPTFNTPSSTLKVHLALLARVIPSSY